MNSNRPVSYTHLDVYKRQEEWVIECNLEGEGNAFLYIENKQNGVSLDFNYDSNKGATTIIDPVSYTHLDVYKRQ